MADLTITAANVVPAASAVVASGTLAETATAGEPVYRSTIDGKLYLADASGAGTDDVVGILVNGGSADQIGNYVLQGDLAFGAILTVGESYFLSDTAGGIKPDADLASSEFVTFLGIATTTSNLRIGLLTSGAQVP